MDYHILIFASAAALLCGAIFCTASKLFKTGKPVVSRKALENLLDRLDICLFVNEAGSCRLLFVNEKAKRHFNVDGSVIGRYCYDVLGHCHESKSNLCPKKRLQKNPDEIISCELRRKAGGRLYRQFDFLIDWNGVKDAQLVHLIDLTDSRKAEKQLRLMEAFINGSKRTVMACVRDDGKFSFFNPYFNELSGYSPQEMEKSGAAILFGNKSQRVLKEEIFPQILKNGEYRFEMPLVNKNGKARHMDYLGFLVESDSTEFGFAGSDITEMRELEEELLRANEAAEHADSAKIEFIKAMSHEIRTPMNAIIGMTKIALSTDDPLKKEECLKKIDKASRGLLDAIDKAKEQPLPIPDAAAVPETEFRLDAVKSAEALASGERKVVLLAEDVEIERELITMSFEGTGVEFDFAKNGQEAAAMFSENPDRYCLILMDVQMPVMDGYQAARRIRALEFGWAKQIPIIAMTANVFKVEIDMCFEVGMDDHIEKPVDMDLLKEKVIGFVMPVPE